jgi:DNA-directed RNA polymerase specialized sigma24 family protein
VSFYEDPSLKSCLFPETQQTLLAAAADGRWNEFLDAYLRPCWKNLAAACRAKGLDLHDADDLFQELILRLMRPGRFGAETLRKAQETGLSQFRGNLPARYLRLRDLPLQSAKFRTYVKAVTANLLAEELRARRRRARHATPQELDVVKWLDQSVAQSFDRSRLWEVIRSAVDQLYSESVSARTRGRSRYFAYLYHSTTEGCGPGAIAVRYGLDRATASKGLESAKRRFIEIVQSLCGDDAEQAARLIVAEPQETAAIFRVYRAAVESTPATQPKRRRASPKTSPVDAGHDGNPRRST